MSITLSCMYEKPLYFYFSNGTNNFFSYSGLLKLLGSYSITLTNLVIIWTLRTNQLVYWIMTPKKHTGLSLNQYSVQELVEFFLTAADLISYCALKGSPQSVFIELYCFFVLDKIQGSPKRKLISYSTLMLLLAVIRCKLIILWAPLFGFFPNKAKQFISKYK